MTALVTKHLPLVSGAPDGIKKLRELVLELAVCGRLLAQDASDEPAELLIERIEALKALQISSGAVKRQKATTQPTVQPNHAMPESWRFVQLGDVVEIVRGITFPASEKSKEPSPGRIACLRTANVQSQIEWDDLLYIDESFVSREDQFLQPNDIVMSMANSRELVGKVALVGGELLQRSTFGGFLGVLRPYLIEPRFVMALLRTPSARSALIDSASQTTNIANISLGKLRPLMVALPPLSEQHRIVAKVDELMALCDRLEADQADAEAAHAQLVQALLDSLTQATDAADFRASWQRLSEHFHTLFTTEASIDALKAAVLELGVTGRLVKGAQAERTTSVVDLVSLERRATLSAAKSIKHEELANAVYWDCPYDLPKDWSWVSLAALVMQITDGTHHTPTYVERGVPFISVKDLDGKTVSFEDCRQIPEAEHEAINTRCNPERGDLLLCRIGTLGRPTIVDTDRPFSLFVSVGLLKMPKRIDLSNFLHLVLSSPLGYRQYERIKAGGSHTNKLNLGDIPKIMIPVPPLEDQRSIIAKVDELMALCDQLKTQLAKARQQHAQLASVLVEQAVGAS